MFSTLRFPVGLVAATLYLAVACKKEAPPAPAPPPPPAAPAPAAAPKLASRVEVQVTDAGFEPGRIPAKAGKPLTLAITRKTDRTCAREILFAGQEGKTELPLNKTVEVTYTPKASGEVKFGCAMGMMVGGVLAVSD
jgi:plastocyanin domain-containing protein